MGFRYMSDYEKAKELMYMFVGFSFGAFTVLAYLLNSGGALYCSGFSLGILVTVLLGDVIK